MGHEDESAPPAAAGAAGGVPIVAVGASAGGLRALRPFFAGFPDSPGAAFVLVLHLHPDQPSHLVEILSGYTRMPVVGVDEEMVLEADHVYAVTPGTALVVRDGSLAVVPAGERPRHPIDTLFTTLAEHGGETVAAVVLSGTGGNGIAGIRAVKEAGGAVFVQDPATAEFQDMPYAAMQTGTADRVLAPEAMGQEIVGFLAYQTGRDAARPEAATAEETGTLERVLSAVASRTGQDFRGYKTSTLLRRVRRRMGLHRIGSLTDYEALLGDSAEEADALLRDLLINVTRFFRDPGAWETLAETVVRPLVDDIATGQEVRAWVPGCATGEEAYTLAILLFEAADAAGKDIALKVFATDPAHRALDFARAGLYPHAIAEQVGPGRLSAFFTRENEGYRVGRRLREALVFAPHNVLADPPFSRMNVVSCRNLLIYLARPLQERVVALLHFSLVDGGCLFLGPAETTGTATGMFEPLSKVWRIYRRIGPTRHDLATMPHGGADMPRLAPGRLGIAERSRAALLDAMVPPSVVVDARSEVVYFHGDTDRFLRQPRGEPTRDLLGLVREGLEPAVRSALFEARQASASVELRGRMRGEPPEDVLVRAVPVRGADLPPDCVVVSFLPVPERAAPADAETPAASPEALSDALATARVEMRGLVDQLEISNQELRASNEEMISMNEELQSSNEELETSREELQSVNEELNTVNAQLQAKIEELEEKKSDLDNLMKSSEIAALFLDLNLGIRWFTPAVQTLIPVLANDVGRPIAHLVGTGDGPPIAEDAAEVLRTLQVVEREVRDAEGRFYIRRTLPYRTVDNRIDGVVITFFDITARKLTEEDLQTAKAFAESIVETVKEILIVLDERLVVVSANAAFEAHFGRSPDEAVGRPIGEALPALARAGDLVALLGTILPERGTIEDLEITFDDPAGEARTMRLTARQLDAADQILVALRDVTESRRLERRRQALVDELQHRVRNLFANIRALLMVTARRSDSVESFSRTFDERLAAMERTQDLFKEGVTGALALGDLVRSELAAHGTEDDARVALDGDEIELDRVSGQALGMVIHELATNALKHGALRAPDGRVAISWSTLGVGEDMKLLFRWRESGVGPVAQPERSGFGSELIRELVPYMLNGRAELRFLQDGVACDVEIPLGPRKPAPSRP